jgi:hypothetical protein
MFGHGKTQILHQNLSFTSYGQANSISLDTLKLLTYQMPMLLTLEMLFAAVVQKLSHSGSM